MKKSNEFDDYLVALGKEVMETLIRRGAKVQDAEDTIQNTFYKIYSSLSAISSETIRPWFFRVAMNDYIDSLRKEKNKQKAVEKIVNGTINVFEEASPFLEENFLNLIQQVNANYQELLILKYYYGFSEKEIAEILMTSSNNVKQTLYRARKALKKQMEE